MTTNTSDWLEEQGFTKHAKSWTRTTLTHAYELTTPNPDDSIEELRSMVEYGDSLPQDASGDFNSLDGGHQLIVTTFTK